jgi:hypothetical protein
MGDVVHSLRNLDHPDPVPLAIRPKTSCCQRPVRRRGRVGRPRMVHSFRKTVVDIRVREPQTMNDGPCSSPG